MRLPKRLGSIINSDPSVVVLCFQPSSFLWQSRSLFMMKRQGLVVTAWGLSSDREPSSHALTPIILGCSSAYGMHVCQFQYSLIHR